MKIKYGKNKTEKYKSGNTNRKDRSDNTYRIIHIGKYKSEHTNRKITDRRNTNWEIQIGKYKSSNTNRRIQFENAFRKTQFGEYKSESTNRIVQIGTIHMGRYTSENTREPSPNIQARRYKSEKYKWRNTNVRVQFGKYKSEKYK